MNDPLRDKQKTLCYQKIAEGFFIRTVLKNRPDSYLALF